MRKSSSLHLESLHLEKDVKNDMAEIKICIELGGKHIGQF